MKNFEPNELMLVSAGTSLGKVENIKNELENILNTTVSHYNHPMEQFADGSRNVKFKDSVRGKTLFVYADCYSHEGLGDLNSKYMLYRHIFDAATSNGAKSINVIYPCYPYSRSDRLEDPGLDENVKRVSVMASKVIKDMKTDGINQLITLDVHNPVVLGGTFPVYTTNLGFGEFIQDVIGKTDYSNVELGSTDEGGTKKIGKLAKQLGVNNYSAGKERDNKAVNKVDKIFIEPRYAEITSKDIYVYDDMIDTGGTMCKIVQELATYKPNSITIVSTHGMFHSDAIEKLGILIEQGLVKEIYVTDSIERLGLPERIKIIPTAKRFAQAIEKVLM